MHPPPQFSDCFKLGGLSKSASLIIVIIVFIPSPPLLLLLLSTLLFSSLSHTHTHTDIHAGLSTHNSASVSLHKIIK